MPTRMQNETGIRPDDEIAREVIRRMKEDIEVPDDRITIKVADGFVTIAGIVNHAAQKDATERCAARVKGVRGITNKIDVGPAAPL